MIDFPASPTDGQVFNAPNGVAYQYSATYSSWLAQSAAPGVGPYLPLTGGTLAGPGTLVGTTATFNGGGFNGALKVTTNDSIIGGLFAGATKGVRIVPSAAYTAIEGVDNTGVGSYQPLTISGSVVNIAAPLSGTTATLSTAIAAGSNDTTVPTTAWVRAASGIWRLASETVLVSNASTMAVTIPVGAKQFQIDFECALVGGSNDTFIINCMQGATPYTTGDHNLQVVSGVGSSASAALNTGLTGFTLSSGVQWQGRVIGSLTANPRTTFQATAILSTLQSGARVAQTYELDCGCLRSTVTGFQLRATITNLLAGSVARVSVLT